MLRGHSRTVHTGLSHNGCGLLEIPGCKTYYGGQQPAHSSRMSWGVNGDPTPVLRASYAQEALMVPMYRVATVHAHVVVGVRLAATEAGEDGIRPLVVLCRYGPSIVTPASPCASTDALLPFPWCACILPGLLSVLLRPLPQALWLGLLPFTVVIICRHHQSIYKDAYHAQEGQK